MGNSIKYTEEFDSTSLYSENMALGINNAGTTIETGFWNGITPSENGYTIYLHKEEQGPNIWTPQTDEGLINLINRISYNSFDNITDSLTWAISENGVLVSNFDYPNIVTENLVLHLDPGFVPSYPKGGDIFKDISWSRLGASLINSPIYTSSNWGSIELKGDGWIEIPDDPNLNLDIFTFCAWIENKSEYLNWNRIISKKNNWDDTDGWDISLHTGQSNKINVTGSSGVSALIDGVDWHLGGWHFLTVIFNLTYVEVWIDGYYYGNGSIDIIAPNGNKLLIGKILSEDISLWVGNIGVVSIYSSILTPNEIWRNKQVFKSRYEIL